MDRSRTNEIDIGPDETRVEVEEYVKSHPAFERLAAINEVLFHGASVAEMSKRLGLKENTLTKYKSRTADIQERFSDIDFTKTHGNYFCIIHANKRDELHLLAPSTASWQDALQAFLTKRGRVEGVAARRARLKAERDGLAPATVQSVLKTLNEGFVSSGTGLLSVKVVRSQLNIQRLSRKTARCFC